MCCFVRRSLSPYKHNVTAQVRHRYVCIYIGVPCHVPWHEFWHAKTRACQAIFGMSLAEMPTCHATCQRVTFCSSHGRIFHRLHRQKSHIFSPGLYGIVFRFRATFLSSSVAVRDCHTAHPEEHHLRIRPGTRTGSRTSVRPSEPLFCSCPSRILALHHRRSWRRSEAHLNRGRVSDIGTNSSPA